MRNCKRASLAPNAARHLALTVLALCGLLIGAPQSQSQITVKVDSTKNWAGYMNWYSTNDVYVSGGAWGIADLRGAFLPFQSNATVVVLRVNTNTFNTNGYWNLVDGTPNKHLEANLYVDVGTTFAGNDVTFVGTVQSNNLPVGWTCQAVVKEFAAGYAYLGDTRADLVGGIVHSGGEHLWALVLPAVPPGVRHLLRQGLPADRRPDRGPGARYL